MKTYSRISGFSLYELILVMVITAIIAVVATPSLINYLQERRLIGTTMQLYYALQEAKTEAIKNNTLIYVSFQTGSSWCYGLNSGSNCNCSTANSCAIGTTQAPSGGLITLVATGLSNNAVQFDPRQGAASGSVTMTFTNNQGIAMTVEIGLLGSITVCSSQVEGYSGC